MYDWPRPPIHPEDLHKMRELLTPEEYEKLLKRLEVSTVAPAHETAPERRWGHSGPMSLTSNATIDAARPDLASQATQPSTSPT